jgi:hypothetical protein
VVDFLSDSARQLYFETANLQSWRCQCNSNKWRRATCELHSVTLLWHKNHTYVFQATPLTMITRDPRFKFSPITTGTILISPKRNGWLSSCSWSPAVKLTVSTWYTCEVSSFTTFNARERWDWTSISRICKMTIKWAMRSKFQHLKQANKPSCDSLSTGVVLLLCSLSRSLSESYS